MLVAKITPSRADRWLMHSDKHHLPFQWKTEGEREKSDKIGARERR